MIHPSSHPTYNERQQKIIELIDWTLENIPYVLYHYILLSLI